MSNVNKGFNVVTNIAPLPAWPKYVPLKKKVYKKHDKKDYTNNPFSVLNQLNLK